MNERRGAEHLRDPPEACECVRETTDLNSKGDERATSKVIVMDKGDMPRRVEKLPGAGMTGGFRGRALQMTASFIHERSSTTR